jgi:hypothetical protein
VSEHAKYESFSTLTRLGQNLLIFWIDTRPTSSETGNSQKRVKALNVPITA